MLDHSKVDLANAHDVERHAAEIVARRYLATELVENLIPENEALRTVDEHKEQNDETWVRAVYAALSGLRAAAASGYRLERRG